MIGVKQEVRIKIWFQLDQPATCIACIPACSSQSARYTYQKCIRELIVPKERRVSRRSEDLLHHYNIALLSGLPGQIKLQNLLPTSMQLRSYAIVCGLP